MARLTLTNDREMHFWVLGREKESGLTDYDSVELGGVFLAAHRKKRNPIENFFKLPNGDVVATAGTLIYRDLLGRKALERLYDDFDGDIEKVRENAMGDYLVAVKKGSAVVAFGEKYECLLTYYYDDGKSWLVGNSLARVAEAACRKHKSLAVNELALLEAAFADAVTGEDTFFNDVRKLPGTEYVAIDAGTGSMRVIGLPYQRRVTDAADRTFEKMADRYADLLCAKLSVLRNIFGDDITIMATGGMDNRLILAGLLACGAKPRLVHGVGPVEPEDLTIARMYAGKFGLELHEVAWPPYHDAPNSRYDDLYREHGFYATIALSRDYFDTFEHGPLGETPLTLTGFFGELIRRFGVVDRCPAFHKRLARGGASIDQYTDTYLRILRLRVGSAMRVPYDSLFRYMRDKFARLADRFGVERRGGLFERDSLPLVVDPFGRSSPPAWDNALNRFTGCVSVMNTCDLHELAFEVPMQWRENQRFALQVMQRLWPPILDIPFFSHCKLVVLDKNLLELRDPWMPRLVDGAVRRLRKSRAGRGVHDLLRPLHLGRLLLKTGGGLSSDQCASPTEPEGPDPLVIEKEWAVFRARVDSEQREQGLCLIDPNAFNFGVLSLARYWKYLYFIRKVREAAAAP